MEISTVVFWAIFVLLGFYLVNIYNHLVRVKHNVSKAWSNIDILLKQRHDEIPKLVETCKQYMKFEQETLEKVMQARSQVSNTRKAEDMAGLGLAEGALRMGLGQIFALAEDYPVLKANDNFQHLQSRISNLENSISDRREFYNESANINNIGIEQFPDIVVAKVLNFGSRDLLEFETSEIANVNVGQLFNS
jgi:LemA protein